MTASESLLSFRVGDFDSWRTAARQLLVAGSDPKTVFWIDSRSEADAAQSNLFEGPGQTGGISRPDRRQRIRPGTTAAPPARPSAAISVPQSFVDRARSVAAHRTPTRWELLYRMLWRITGGERDLLRNAADRDVHTFCTLEKAVRRDAHKVKAFVRFRQINDGSGERYVAWHRPDHYTLSLTAPFFVRRFDVMRWAILTPDESATWDGEQLTMGPGMPRSAAPSQDELEDLWKTYYANIFNPARIKLDAMRAEMPKKHWSTLPEAELIGPLVRDAGRRVETMIATTEGYETAKAYVPKPSPGKRGVPISQLARAAAACRGCPLHGPATQVVFGVGNAAARLMLIGEQPGDSEDRAGEPFVGPAGRLLREIMAEVSLSPDEIYLTNTVKHFKFRDTGKMRLHVKPAAREIAACRPWLDAETRSVAPDMIVCLGATAAGAVIGPGFRLTKDRGVVQRTDYAKWTMATYHPSALLRVPDAEAGEKMRAMMTADLRAATEHLRMLEETALG